MKNVKLVFLSCFISFFSMSCFSQNSTTMVKNKVKDTSTGDGKYIISGPIILKNIENADAKISNRQEYYIERSIQDYFIKFCESKVTKEQLQAYLSTKNQLIKSATLEIEYRDGEWDNCKDDDLKQQSRTGKYVIVHKIIGE